MKKQIAFSFVLFIICHNCAYGQLETIHLGKRHNVVWDRKISPTNLGSRMCYYYPVFYKSSSMPAYRKSGFLAHRLQTRLNLQIPEVSQEFRQFKHSKIESRFLMACSVVTLSAWTYVSASYMVRTDQYGIAAFYRPQHLPLLGAYFACFYASIYLDLKGDKHLMRSVAAHNRALRKTQSFN